MWCVYVRDFGKSESFGFEVMVMKGVHPRWQIQNCYHIGGGFKGVSGLEGPVDAICFGGVRMGKILAEDSER